MEIVRYRNSQPIRKLCDVVDRYIPNSTFDPACVCAVEVGLFCQFLLGPSTLFAQFDDPLSDRNGPFDQGLMVMAQVSCWFSCTL